MKKETGVFFAGHKEEYLPKTKENIEKLKQKLYEEIDKAIRDGTDTFYVGAYNGFDLMCGDMVLLRSRVIKPTDPQKIKLIAVVAYEHQADDWTDIDRELYFKILSECDEVITISTHYDKNCFKKQNEYMIQRSSKLITYYDGSFRSSTAKTVRMAENQKLKIINLY